MKTIRWTVLFLAMASLAVAQSAKYHYNVTVTVKQGMSQQYEDYIKKIVEAAEKNGDAQNWYAFQPTVGTTGGQYIFVLPHESWAEKDSWTSPSDMLQKAFGEKEAATITRLGTVAVAKSETTESTLAPALSTHLDRNDGVRARYLVSTSHVSPGRGGDYTYGVRKIRGAEAKAEGSPRRTTRRQILGDRNVFTTATGFDSGAERDKWPAFGDYMSAAYSESEISQIMETLAGASERWVIVEIAYRPDLSHPEPASTTSN